MYGGLQPMRQNIKVHWGFSLFIAGMLLVLLPAKGKAEAEAIDVAVGKSQTISLAELASSVNVGQEGVVDVDKGRNKAEIVVRGRRAGRVALEITLNSGKRVSYQVTVSDPSSATQRLASVRSNLANIVGLEVIGRDGKVVLRGKIGSRQGLQRIANIKRQYPGFIIDLTEKEVPATNTVVATINRVLTENDIPNVQAHAYGRIIVLEGTPKDEDESRLVMRIARMIQPDVEDRMSKDASAAPSINIDVMFVEVSKIDTMQFGLNGNVSLGDRPVSDKAMAQAGIGAQSGRSGKMVWQVGALSAFLEMVQSVSSSRVLSNPQLIARSGVEAEFHSGGTFYLESVQNTPQGREVTFQSVKYGIELNILPKIDRLGQIDAKVETTVSDIAAAQVGTLPSLSTSRVSTSVTVRDGQSIMLSGLVNRKQIKNVKRVPLLSDIPILGELFKSRDMYDKDVELLVLVTMNRIGGIDERSHRAEQIWEDASKDVKFSFFD